METTADPGHRFNQQQCSSCDGSLARCWCLDCDEALCDACVSAHRRVTLTRSHRILNQPPAGDVSTPPTKFCRLHPSEPLKLFCFTCNQLTCRDCQLMAHMNHRYQFVSEALSSLKKQVEVRVQPIRALGETARQSLLDMEIRLQEVAQCESHLKAELQQSYSILVQHLKKRMEDILSKVKKVCESECAVIQGRMMKLKQLMQNQQSVTETAEKAKNANDLSTLLTYTAQVASQLKDLPDQVSFPPQMMCQLKVVTDSTSLGAILNFGELEVSWVPFSVSQTSNQNRESPAAAASSSSSSPLTSTCPAPSYKPLPETRTTNDTESPAPVNCPSSYNQLSPPPYPCPSVNQSKAPLTTTTVPKTIECPSTSTVKTLSHLGTNPRRALLPVSTSVNLPPVSFGFSLSSGLSPSCVIKLIKPSSALNQPTAPRQNQPAAVLLTNTNTAYQVSCLPSHLQLAVPQFPMLLSQTVSYSLPGNTWPKQQNTSGSHQILPVAATGNQIPVGPSQTALPSHQPLKDVSCTAVTSDPLPPPEGLSSDVGPHSSSLKHQQSWSPVVRAAADSACERSVWQVAVKQEPAENEPTSTVSEETEPAGKPSPPEPAGKPSPPEPAGKPSPPEPAGKPSPPEPAGKPSPPEEPEPAGNPSPPEEPEPAGKPSPPEPAGNPSPPEVSDREAKEPSPVTGHPDWRLSQWQPRVCLFRLLVSPSRPGCPLPGFRLVPGDAKDEIYLQEMSEDTQSHADDITDYITEPLSSPESPVTLQIVSCSACGSASGSIICSSCGRGYHRDCHVPPIGPDLWSEWLCSLCQDLENPSDPYSSDRPQRPQSPCLSLLDQRRCERLLLHLKVEGCARLSERGLWSRVELMSERLTLRRSPAYRTAAELLSDVWSLLTDASQGHQVRSSASQGYQDDEALNKLQESLRSRLVETFGSELHPSVLKPPSRRRNTEGRPRGPLDAKTSGGHEVTEGSKVTSEEQEAIPGESKLKAMRKRLRDFLDLVGTSEPKRTKM